MMTLGGARATLWDKDLGSLEVGKKADVVLFDTDRPNWYPRHHLPSVLVYQASSDDVRTVVIDGRVVLRDREPAFDTDGLYERAQRASEAVVERAGMTPLLRRGWQSESRI